MSLRKRLLQLTVVAGLGAVGMLATPDQALAGSTWCASSCGAAWICDTSTAGFCDAISCKGIDGVTYPYTIRCVNAS